MLTEPSYKCGARYKTCSCDDNDDNRLAADGDIDIPAVVAAMNEAERQENEMVEQEQMEIDYDYQRMTEIILQEYRGGQQQQMGEVRNSEDVMGTLILTSINCRERMGLEDD